MVPKKTDDCVFCGFSWGTGKLLPERDVAVEVLAALAVWFYEWQVNLWVPELNIYYLTIGWITLEFIDIYVPQW